MAEETKPASDPLARPPIPQHQSAAAGLAQPDRHTPMDGVARRRQQSYGNTSGFMDPGPRDSDMMGPLLRRKKVVSLPLGGQDNDLFFGNAPPRQDNTPASKATDSKPNQRVDSSWPKSPHKPQRKKQNSFIDNMIRRKQVSLDLYAPNQAAFFSVPEQDLIEEESMPFAPKILEEEPSAQLEEGVEASKIEPIVEEEAEPPVKLFVPLQFCPPIKGGRGGGPGQVEHGGAATLGQARSPRCSTGPRHRRRRP
jgi:hypothetical protein